MTKRFDPELQKNIRTMVTLKWQRRTCACRYLCLYSHGLMIVSENVSGNKGTCNKAQVGLGQ